jgi:hypothetical protein
MFIARSSCVAVYWDCASKCATFHTAGRCAVIAKGCLNVPKKSAQQMNIWSASFQQNQEIGYPGAEQAKHYKPS